MPAETRSPQPGEWWRVIREKTVQPAEVYFRFGFAAGRSVCGTSLSGWDRGYMLADIRPVTEAEAEALRVLWPAAFAGDKFRDSMLPVLPAMLAHHENGRTEK